MFLLTEFIVDQMRLLNCYTNQIISCSVHENNLLYCILENVSSFIDVHFVVRRITKQYVHFSTCV